METVFAEEREAGAISPFAEIIVAMVQGISALWEAIVHPPSTRPELPAAQRETPRPATEEEKA